jgi:hypothetical protein
MAEITIYDSTGKPTKFGVVQDSLLPAGKRAIVSNYRATNVSDPGRIRVATWEIWGPIGASRESVSGILATDYVQNLDTRFPRRLLSKGARNAVTLTTKDPTNVSGTGKLGEFKLGDLTNKLGGPVSASHNVTHFDEQDGRLYAHRGKLSTQVLISSWAVQATAIHPEEVAGAVGYFGKGRVGLGAAAKMRTRVSASSTGAVYEETTTLIGEDVYAGPLAVGSDRCWFITKGSNGELENLVGYTLDGFQTINNPFPVGDARVKANGIGPFGPFTFFGNRKGLNSFTDQGKPVPLSRALSGHDSEHNGKQFADTGWGWNYAITDVGLRALTSHIDNPVGIGERMREFNGHGGRPTAIWPERGELFVVYQTAAGDSYAYRGVFGASTAQTGQPDFYPWWYKASTTCEAVFSTNTPTNTALVWGEGTNMAYETISRDGRDDLFSARTYEITQGSWKVAWSFDEDDYLQIGEITEDGYHTVRPVQEQVGVPLLNISGRSMKPRLVLDETGSTDEGTWFGTELDRDPHLIKTLRLNRLRTKNLGSNAASPEVNGTLEVEYDERPEYITETAVAIQLDSMSKEGVITLLESYRDAAEPLKVRLPDRTGDSYAMVANVTNRRDIKPDGIEAIDLILHIWDVS